MSQSRAFEKATESARAKRITSDALGSERDMHRPPAESGAIPPHLWGQRSQVTLERMKRLFGPGPGLLRGFLAIEILVVVPMAKISGMKESRPARCFR